MGVIKNASYNLPVKLTLSEESINSLGFVSEPPTPPVEAAAPVTNFRAPNPTLILQRLEQCPRKKIGSRKERRFNNARMLQTLVEEETEHSSVDPTFEDFCPNSRTPLTRLMTDFSSMRIWQYFTSQSEEEQKLYLDSLNSQKQIPDKRGIYFSQLESKLCSADKSDPSVSSISPVDTRVIHPSFSAEQRFSKVDSSLRSILKRRHLPLGMIAYHEKDIISVFSGDVNAVYISQSISSFERLLLHGICQYNLLKSWSIDVAGSRRTKVENKYTTFLTPKISLADFLEKRLQRLTPLQCL